MRIHPAQLILLIAALLMLLSGCSAATSPNLSHSEQNPVLGPPDTAAPSPTLVPASPTRFTGPTVAPTVPRAASRPDDPVLLAAGDIAVCGTQEDEATGRLLATIPGTIAALGDEAYPSGTAFQFANCYGPSWGQVKARTRPVPGNHEYATRGASGYFGYFGAAAGPTGKGYYSYDLGAWHIVALNSEIDASAGSAQEQWLRADLATHGAACTLAYWHKPRFSSGPHGSDSTFEPLWQALYDFGADIVLNGHDHDYERFAPQTPDGKPDSAHGIREFVVGTGGATLYPLVLNAANSVTRNSQTWGVLKLTLHGNSYDWQFLHAAGGDFTDSGSAQCH